VQHDAPPWRDCLCYCNPCWLDHGGAWAVDDDEGVELGQTRPPEKSMPLYAAEDQRLPADYDAMREYERRFGEFNLANGEERPARTNAIQLSSDALFEAARTRLERGDPEAAERSLYTDFNLYVLTIRQCHDDRRRHELIEAYEAVRHKYRAHRICAGDAQVARDALEQARDRGSAMLGRLEAYRKAIFFTHSLADKVALQDEYRQYCRTLASRSR
jgi:hypothetical protein